VRIVAVVVAALAVTRAASAHPLAPSLLELRELGAGRVEVAWKRPLLRPRGLDPVPALPARCRQVSPPATVPDEGAVWVRWTVDCGSGGLVGERVGVGGLGDSGLAALVRVTLADGRLVQGIVTAGRPAIDVPSRPRPWDVVRDYVWLGVEHILGGPDHLLFVFGLVLLAGTVRRVAATVTAFTLGHSVTLSLAALGLVTLPTAPIEMLIAASVLALAAELAREPDRPTLMRRFPWGMAATFGLLHGLGFAAALAEAGLPQSDIPLALFAFNVGIEIGQLAFVLVVLAAGRVLGRLPLRFPAWMRQVPVYAMGTLAAFWWFERTAALFR
jgi:hydrogenase/urease accessory protein HupE